MWGLSGQKSAQRSPLQEAAEEVTANVKSKLQQTLEDGSPSSSSSSSKQRLDSWTDIFSPSDAHNDDKLNSVQAYFQSEQFRKAILSPPALIAITLGATTASYRMYRRYFRRISTAAYLTPSTLHRRTIVGKCLSVGDADGFRLYHTPGPLLYRQMMYSSIKPGHHANNANGHSGGGSFTQRQTISVRLAGADAPESSHFGKPAQPFSKEAKEELTRMILGRQVWCQVAHIDQYQRLVATPYVWTAPYVFGRTNVSLHLVKRGLATVYTSAGAAYGTAGAFVRFLRWTLGVDTSKNTTEKNAKTAILDRILPLSGEARLRRAQAYAKRKKLGVWSLRNFEPPEEYKKRMRSASS